MRIRLNNNGVSHIVGYMFMLFVVSFLTAASLYTVSVLIDRETVKAAEKQAQAIANHVADAVVEAASVRMQLPAANYCRVIDIPHDIAGKQYYIEIDDYNIYVNSSDGTVSVNQTNYNLEELSIGTSGKAYGSNGRLKVFFNRSDYVYRLDFGTRNSSGELGYERTGVFSTSNWWNEDWRCRVPIYLINSGTKSFQDVQIRITLTPNLVGYLLMNDNASDIRFTDSSGNELSYWIEQWSKVGYSRVWVNVSSIASDSTTVIYMYYNNPFASPKNNGTNTFPFFDDFNGDALDTSKWNTVGSDIEVKDGKLIITDEGAVTSKKRIYSDSILDPTDAFSLNCKVGASAYTSANKEGSMFLFSSSNDASFLDNSYLFSSGSFASENERNLSLIKDNNTVLTRDIYNSSMGWGWKRLQYSYNPNSDYHSLYRYDYESYSLEGSCGCINDSYNDGYFGLCNCHNNVKTVYDWFFIIKDVENVNYTIGLEECLDYWWSNSDDLSSVEQGSIDNLLRSDSVFNASSVNDISFHFSNLSSGTYSVTLVVGDAFNSTNDLSVWVDNGVSNTRVFNGLECEAGHFIERWFTVETSKYITVKFSSPGVKHVCALVLERGIKGIRLKGV